MQAAVMTAGLTRLAACHTFRVWLVTHPPEMASGSPQTIHEAIFNGPQRRFPL